MRPAFYGYYILLLLASGACQTAAATEPPVVGLITATTGRLPLRRQTNGVVRARRRADLLALQGGPLERSPTEGRYFAAGDRVGRACSPKV